MTINKIDESGGDDDGFDVKTESDVVTRIEEGEMTKGKRGSDENGISLGVD